MTEDEFRRGTGRDAARAEAAADQLRPRPARPGDDLFARLELIHEALTAVAEAVAAGRVPGDGTERDRCRRAAELLASQGRRVVDLLGRPPVAGHEARVVSEQDRIIDEARDRGKGEEP